MLLVKQAYMLTSKFPAEERYALTSQIKRAAISVPSNIAEGMGRKHKKDPLQFLHVARGSLYELETLIEIAIMLGLISKDEYDTTIAKVQQSLKVLNGLIKYIAEGQIK